MTVSNPRLWGPVPSQTPHRYVIVSQVYQGEKLVDEYHTLFGIRKVEFDPNQGVLVNGEHIALQGVNQHHDLGALGAAFNVRAAQRQLEILQEMGVNAIRMAHNPPAPELLALTDKMGILVLNESFDSWYKKKTPHDFHLIFADWHEQDLRALVRRDRNHPSVIMWYIGNEVGEQYTGEEGAEVALKLKSIVKQEDPTRPVTASKNWAKADFPFSAALDLISLNYQGEGIRQAPEFEGTNRIRTPPSYPAFHKAHPDKVILSSETASAFSSRGIYLFPVTPDMSSPTRDGRGGDSSIHQVSSYELLWILALPQIKYSNTSTLTPMWPDSLCGMGLITSVSQPRIILRAVHIQVLLTWLALKKTAFICTRANGGQTCPWCIFCHTGTGPSVLVKSPRYIFLLPATKLSYSSTDSQWDVRKWQS